MKKFIRNLFWTKWKVARTIWPYNEGWGVFRSNWLTGEQVITDTGLIKSDAEAIAKEMNHPTKKS